jgi:hypothetical protein
VKRSTRELGRYVRERQARIDRLQAEIRADFNESLAGLLGAETPKAAALRRAERELEAALDQLIPRRGG